MPVYKGQPTLPQLGYELHRLGYALVQTQQTQEIPADSTRRRFRSSIALEMDALFVRLPPDDYARRGDWDLDKWLFTLNLFGLLDFGLFMQQSLRIPHTAFSSECLTMDAA